MLSFNGRAELYGIGMRAQRGLFSSGWLTVISVRRGFFDQNLGGFCQFSRTDSLTYFVELLKKGPPDTCKLPERLHHPLCQ